MICPNLLELPPPPDCKTSWPWVVGSNTPVIKQMTEYPSICIVTPSLNQGEYIEETIRSILLQGYPNLEFIIMDGGSTDNSVEIIKKYSQWLTHWVSKKDKGQGDSIFRGFEESTSDIVGWVNSDDMLMPNALFGLGKYFVDHPDVELVVGGGVTIDNKARIKPPKWADIDFYYMDSRISFLRILIMGGFNFLQPASLWKREAFFAVGGFDRSLEFCFDLDLYLRLTKRKFGRSIPQPVAAFRTHLATKTSRLQHVRLEELEQVLIRHGLMNYPGWIRTSLAIGYRIWGIIRHKIALLNYLIRPQNMDILQSMSRELKNPESLSK
jgi:glycosyltransferase involved in cell wall biosynthesis